MPGSGGRPPPPKLLFDKYELGRLLGCGAFAKVYHARHTRSGHSVAIKIVSKVKILRSGLVPNIKREISIMRRLRHPHIVRLHEVLATRSKIFFVLDYIKGGELFALLSSRGRLPEDRSRRFFHQLLSAVAFCHSRGVFHRDLKPENLLLDDSGDLKVSDFGLSTVSDQIRPDGLFHTLCGTPAYVAPEILSKKGYDGAKVDIWSCGVVLFVLNAGYLPFNDPNLMAMYRKIYRGDYRIPRWTSPELKRLISRLLDTNPATRITVDGIFSDPWFRTGLDEEKMRSMMRFHDEGIEERISNSKEEGDLESDRELNAFDIISFSPGCDLSGMIGDKTDRERFVSAAESAETVVETVERIGIGEGLVVRKRNKKGKGRSGVAVEGQDGNLVVWVEVYRLLPGLVVVEVERGEEEGGSRWSSEFWREKLRPASEPATPVAGNRVEVDVIRPASEPVTPVGLGPEVEFMDGSMSPVF